MVRKTIEGSWLRMNEKPYLWFEEPTQEDVERIRGEIREPKHSDEDTGPSFADLVRTI